MVWHIPLGFSTGKFAAICVQKDQKGKEGSGLEEVLEGRFIWEFVLMKNFG